jgi:endonuclease III
MMGTSLGKKAERVLQLLAEVYHSPRHNNKSDPVDEIIFIILSQMTTRKSYERVYDHLKQAIPDWESVRLVHIRKLRTLIRSAGLARQKANWIRAILNQIHSDFGSITLEPLRRRPTPDAEAYLIRLPGVNLKTARCVLLYSLGRKVLPVDTHVLRVARRVGLLPTTVPVAQAHCLLESLVQPADRYKFHVNVLAHGRAVCQAKFPRCDECILKRICWAYVSGCGTLIAYPSSLARLPQSARLARALCLGTRLPPSPFSPFP